ncbi:phosphotransferase [Candidatus Dojkabacteria bacterium]|nr:phosphotransferase [Candidatus Dojkabacteria bacterium]
MLTEPKNKSEKMTDCLTRQYGIQAKSITFMPLGADANTIVYKVESNKGEMYLLKIRTDNFDETSVLIPHYLHEQKVEHIITPVLTEDLQPYYFDGIDYLTVYPFIDTLKITETEFTDDNKVVLGALMKKIHRLKIPNSIKSKINKYEFSSKWAERLVHAIDKIQKTTFNDQLTIELVQFIKEKDYVIRSLINYSQELTGEPCLVSDEFVLCHGDLHFWNLITDKNNYFYLIDWDTVILAPKERDLMFIGSKIDNLWNTSQDIDLFYEGYGMTDINKSVQDYFRADRIIEDLVIMCDSICFSNISEEDKLKTLGFFKANFKANNTIEAVLGEKLG